MREKRGLRKCRDPSQGSFSVYVAWRVEDGGERFSGANWNLRGCIFPRDRLDRVPEA